MYCFLYESGIEELIEYLMNNTDRKRYIRLSDTMELNIKGNNIMLRKKKLISHPLQRVFIGKIDLCNDKSRIMGKFKYPIINTIIFSLLCIFLLEKNIEAIIIISNFYNKIMACCIFLAMYLGIVVIFVTAKTCFKAEEKEVIDFLRLKSVS